MTPRKAGVLAMHLPPGAQTWVALGHDAAWTNAEHLAALQVDVAQLANWQRGGGEGPKPKPISRPGDDLRATVRGRAIEAKAKAFLARQSAPQPTARKRDARGRFVKE